MSTAVTAIPSDHAVTSTSPSIALVELPPHTHSGPIRYTDLLITRKQLSDWLHVSVSRLGRWAREGYGPEPLRIGRYKCAYKISSVLAFLDAQSAAVCPDTRRKPNREIPTPKA